MASENGTFTGPDGTEIFYQCWLPGKKVKGALVIVHGLGEHSGRYMNLVNHFEPLGFSIYGLDHFGHGRSKGPRLFVPRFDIYTDTLKMFVKKVQEWEPSVPVFLVGHSMGGLIAAVYLLDHQDRIKGAVLSGPAVKIPDHINPALCTAAKMLSRIMPRLGLSGLDAEHISRDPQVMNAYMNDPLVFHGKITARLGEQLLASISKLNRQAEKINIPLLIMHGESDLLADTEGSRQFFNAVSSPDKKLVIWPDRYHEIFNDPGYEAVLSDMEDWISERIPHDSGQKAYG